eukprot:CAMPEP_0202895424 /NCGR_PEP_ID=MMETSP1392-20130828/4633_1 /ASSEMBLY_ACC=CAM_ASM_000868 /TAXON_ID=225041 /ORGANISM="Chlamydomonas chlamydogama, Strain SAG 11-48b" /LENGTH=140 /DNA_ID=CAMNT_0049580433 /DNA_START=548 /DNA_END=970 /DNA_ORIENTATION=-
MTEHAGGAAAAVAAVAATRTCTSAPSIQRSKDQSTPDAHQLLTAPDLHDEQHPPHMPPSQLPQLPQLQEGLPCRNGSHHEWQLLGVTIAGAWAAQTADLRAALQAKVMVASIQECHGCPEVEQVPELPAEPHWAAAVQHA